MHQSQFQLSRLDFSRVNLCCIHDGSSIEIFEHARGWLGGQIITRIQTIPASNGNAVGLYVMYSDCLKFVPHRLSCCIPPNERLSMPLRILVDSHLA